MNRTKIDYLTHTFNPLAMRCTPRSPACHHCWHLRLADRLSKNPTIKTAERAAYAGAGNPVLRRDELEAPLRLKKPAVIGTQFMGDLFHKTVSDQQREAIFNAMRACPQHKFLLLTKRADRMLEWYSEFEHFNHGISAHIWPGVTVEDQPNAERRISYLIKIPAAVRWISAEPLLGPIDLSGVLTKPAWKETPAPDGFGQELVIVPRNDLINFVVAGGETGPGARPVHPDWVRSLRDQCQAAGVSFFFKGWGEWAPGKQAPALTDAYLSSRPCQLLDNGSTSVGTFRVGKKYAGRLLDGRTWDEFPGKPLEIKRCPSCNYPTADGGPCGECACEDDCG